MTTVMKMLDRKCCVPGCAEPVIAVQPGVGARKFLGLFTIQRGRDDVYWCACHWLETWKEIR